MRTTCSRIVQDWLGHPRAVLGSFSLLMFVVTVATELASPQYIIFPNLSIATAALGSASCAWALVRPSMWSLALAGASIAGAIAARGFGITATLLLQDWEGDRSFTLLVGGTAWLTILTMLPPVWSKHLIPWGVAKVMVKEG